MSLIGKLRKQKKFGFELAFRVVARLTASLGQAGFLVLLAREIGPVEFGAVAIVLAIGYIVSALTSFGTSTRILRLAAETEVERVATKFLYMRLTGTVLTVLVCSLLALTLSPSSTFLAVAMIASDQVIDYVQAYLAGRNKQVKSSLIVILQRMVPFLVIAFLSLLSVFSSTIIILTFLLTLFLSVLIPIRDRAGSVKYWSTDTWSELKSSAGYWMSSLAPNIGQLQAPALGLALGTASVGIFAIAARLTNPLTILVGALQALLLPELARRRGTVQFHTLYKASVAASATYGFLLCSMAWFIADGFVFLLGREYETARSLIVGMIVASGMSVVSQAFQSKLLAEGRPSEVAWSIGLGSLIGLAGLVLIADLGGLGWLWLSPILTQIFIGVTLSFRAGATLPTVGRHSR